MKKSFIEESFPVREVSEESAREKNIRHGHISTLHIWWARRPLASSRATIYASLIPPEKTPEEWNKERNFIIELSKWENSLNQDIIGKAIEKIRKSNGNRPLRMLDPFAGGGSIPLEAMRLGLEAHAIDYNPVATLILKCTLEYPFRLGGLGLGDWGLGKDGGNIENTELSRPGSMEEGGRFNREDLQNMQGISTRGEIFPDKSDSEGSDINSFKHRGGMGQEFKEGVHSISEYSSGISMRTGDSSNNSSENWIHQREYFKGTFGRDSDSWKNVARTNSLFGEEITQSPIPNPLLAAVKHWGQWVLEEAKKEIGKFYPHDPDGSVPVGYIWSRTIPCQNPSCGAEIPLMRQFWLAKKDKKKVSLFPYIEGKEVKFKIVGTGYEPMPKGFDPEQGTVSRAHAKCLVCGAVVDDKTTRRLFQEGRAGQRMIAVVLTSGNSGKKYRVATEKDVRVFREAERYLEEKRQKLMEEWGIDPVPDEPLPPKETLGFRVQRYGILKWGDLFNSRQKLALITFTEKVRELGIRGLEFGIADREFKKAVVSYLALGVNRLADFGSVLCVLNSTGGRGVVHTFGRQALPMSWDYIESNPFYPLAAGWNTAIEKNLKWIEHASSMFNSTHLEIPNPDTPLLLSKSASQSPNPKFPIPNTVVVTQASATSLPYPDNFFDAVFTDPPYYDNVPYSYLSDFFYVWLKRTLGDIYPELFATPLTPKTNEIVAYSHNEGGFEGGKKFFEENLKKAFQEIYRVLKPEGIAVIVYAHKSTAGWETLINSLLDCGLVITASWPLDTEMKSRLRANESAALASSIYLVARKIQRKPIGYLNEVKDEIKEHLKQKLQNLWKEGVSGGDFFIAGIGSAIEVFGKYEKVMDYEGNIIRADRLLEFVREIVTDYAVREILHNGVAGEISPLTRFYILYRWLFGEARAEFDEVRKLASSSGFEIADYFNRSFIKKEKEFIKILGPHERDLEEFEFGANSELIDVLHKCLVLWSQSKNDEIVKLLHESGYGYKEVFYKVAQAVSECLPIESKEKKMLDGFLTGKERYIDGIKKQSEPKQGRLI